MLRANQIKPNTPVVYSQNGPFGIVNRSGAQAMQEWTTVSAAQKAGAAAANDTVATDSPDSIDRGTASSMPNDHKTTV